MTDRSTEVLLVGIGGFLGANARYFLAQWLGPRMGGTFPWPTLLINVSGSMLLGLLLGLILERAGSSPALRLFFATGFLGAYTTFSTFSYETLFLIERGSWMSAAAYAGGSVLAGLLGVTAGVIAGRFLT